MNPSQHQKARLQTKTEIESSRGKRLTVLTKKKKNPLRTSVVMQTTDINWIPTRQLSLIQKCRRNTYFFGCENKHFSSPSSYLQYRHCAYAGFKPHPDENHTSILLTTALTNTTNKLWSVCLLNKLLIYSPSKVLEIPSLQRISIMLFDSVFC